MTTEQRKDNFMRIQPTKASGEPSPIALQKTTEVFAEVDNFFTQNSGTDFTIEDDPFIQNSLVVTYYGKKGSDHEGAIYLVQIIIPAEYPNTAPQCKFVGMIPYHCNVNSTGDICISYLRSWKSTNTILNLLMKLDQFFYCPDFERGYARCRIEDRSGPIVQNIEACKDWARKTRKENSIQKVFI